MQLQESNGVPEADIEIVSVTASSYAEPYRPENILKNIPADSLSRWTSEINDPHQYLLLKLAKPAIVKRIYFGKYMMPHVCNLKELTLEASIDGILYFRLGDTWTLKNDATGEWLYLPYICRAPKSYSAPHISMNNMDLERDANDETKRSIQVPIQYLRIRPFCTWGTSFSYGVWYVQLAGITADAHCQKMGRLFSAWQTEETWKLVNKFLEENNINVGQTDALDHDVVAQLRRLLQSESFPSNHKALEQCLMDADKQQLLVPGLETTMTVKPLSGLGFESSNPKTASTGPCARGGHNMVIDGTHRTLYLFGGFDGVQDLADLWACDLTTNAWRNLTPPEGKGDSAWPAARSVFGMVFSEKRRGFYVLGRFSKAPLSEPEQLKSELWFFDVARCRWTLVQGDTEVEQGPALVYDCQLAVDDGRDLLLVCGGKKVVPYSHSGLYSGLYVLHLDTGVWTQPAYGVAVTALEKRAPSKETTLNKESETGKDQPMDGGAAFVARQEAKDIVQEGRVGHAFLVDAGRGLAWIIGGQRYKEFLTDIICFSYLQPGRIHYVQRQFWDSMQAAPSVSSSSSTPSSSSIGESVRGPRYFFFKAAIDTQKQQLYILWKAPTGTAMAGPTEESPASRMTRATEPRGLVSTVPAVTAQSSDSFALYRTDYHVDAELQPKGILAYYPLSKWTVMVGRDETSSATSSTLPALRFAYSFVWDSIGQAFYVFGGNLGDLYPLPQHVTTVLKDKTSGETEPAYQLTGNHGGTDTGTTSTSNFTSSTSLNVRLNDFWRLCVDGQRPLATGLLYRVRKQVFLELLNGAKSCVIAERKDERLKEALHFLQTQLSPLLDVSNKSQMEDFAALPQLIFSPVESSQEQLKRDTAARRADLLRHLLAAFPSSMQRPKRSLQSFTLLDLDHSL